MTQFGDFPPPGIGSTASPSGRLRFKPDANAEQPSRPWRDIAEEMSYESDSERLNELAQELWRAVKKTEDQE